MVRNLAVSFLFFLIVLQSSCKTLEIEGNLVSPNNLELKIPVQEFDLKFATGYKSIKEQNYYFESSRWISQDRSKDFFGSYTFFLGDYIFVDEPTVEELISQFFEDRVVSIGEKRKLVESRGSSKRDKVTTIVPFSLENAECHFFQRFLYLGSEAYDYISSGAVSPEDQGDAKIKGYLCNYGKSVISDQRFDAFVSEIDAGTVFADRHIKELESLNAENEKTKQQSSDAEG